MATVLKESRCFGGIVRQLTHASTATRTPMNFTVFLPPGASSSTPVPVLYWLSGLTCTDENFITKAGAQRVAAQRNVALVCPDTSPRGAGIEGEDDAYDFGTGAGFYVNATQQPWAANYNMFDYVTKELPGLLAEHDIDAGRAAISGHSMGGHGALIMGLRNPDKYVSVSAFAPICNPSGCAWGRKALAGYLGDDREAWKEYDATELMAGYKGRDLSLLVDQGAADEFFTGKQLLPEHLEAACKAAQVPLTMRYQEGYDHSYNFIASFIDDHINWHADRLEGKN